MENSKENMHFYIRALRVKVIRCLDMYRVQNLEERPEKDIENYILSGS